MIAGQAMLALFHAVQIKRIKNVVLARANLTHEALLTAQLARLDVLGDLVHEHFQLLVVGALLEFEQRLYRVYVRARVDEILKIVLQLIPQIKRKSTRANVQTAAIQP